MKRIIFVVLIAAVLLIWSGVASAGGEILGCQGGYNNNTTRQSERIASFSLSNFNDSAVIILQRIAIYDRLGDVLCDTDQGPIGNMSEGDEIAPNGSQWFNVGPTNCPGVAPTGETNYSGKIYWFTPGKYKNPLHGRTTYRTWNTGINPNRIEA